MKNRKMLRRMSVKCAAAIMAAALIMSSAAVPLAFPVTAYAETEHEDDGSVRVYSEGEDETDNVGVVEADAAGKAALSVDNRFGGAELTVTAGNVENVNPNGGGLEAEAAENGKNVISLTGSELRGEQYSLSAKANDGGSNTVSIECKTGKIQVTADNSGSNTVKEKGRVDETGADSVNAKSDNSGSNTVDLDGGVNTVSATADNSGNNTIATGGNAGEITAKAENSGTNTVSVAGGILNLEANADTKGSNTVNIKGDANGLIKVTVLGGGSNTVNVGGNVGIGVIAASKSTSGENNVLVGGDVGSSGSTAGVIISDRTGENHIVIEGTVKGSRVGVAIQENEDNPLPKDTLTVWKIEKHSDGAVAGRPEGGGFVRDTKAEETIQYIIKVAEPEAGAALRATDANGNALNTTKGTGGKELEWAYEGDTVLLKIDLQEGYEIVGAYGDEGQAKELQKDGQGNYYIKVPKGGGVLLSVKVIQTPSTGSTSESDDHGSTSASEPFVQQDTTEGKVQVPGGAGNSKADEKTIEQYSKEDIPWFITNILEQYAFFGGYQAKIKSAVLSGFTLAGEAEARKQATIAGLANVMANRYGLTGTDATDYIDRFIALYTAWLKTNPSGDVFTEYIVNSIAINAMNSNEAVVPIPTPDPSPDKPDSVEATGVAVPVSEEDQLQVADNAAVQIAADGSLAGTSDTGADAVVFGTQTGGSAIRQETG